MDNSILTSIKKMLGPEEDDVHFDSDIIMCINTALSILTQAGVGPAEGFRITDKTATWKDFIGEVKYLEFVKSFVHIRAKLLFDPPTNSTLVKAFETEANELLWRINAAIETNK